ncbi:nucleotidyltransferase family protein [Thalassotalea nanhaiensis]|uniref:Nucleotidyltransferase family protein n=1 Tax=Thalassotalea nanhaiensis TaxID=3065648 RepID=A0ABY9TEL5_9GAMM|nr:nucleotidyltransferase family protein [Colwelliaceae bacterium SQ345]
MNSQIALVLAAGFSARYGADKRLAGENKPLLIETLDLVCQQFTTVYLVHRNQDDSLLKLIKNRNIRLTPAPADSIGLGTSLATGIRKILNTQTGENISSVSIFLADMPYINSATITMILDASKSDNIVRPVYKNDAGHPVCFGSDFLSQLSQLSGDSGAAKVIRTNPEKLHLIDVNDSGIVTDIDKPSDWITNNVTR